MNRESLPPRRVVYYWNRFFFREADLSICGWMRIAYSVLLLINLLVLLPDLEKWFGEYGVVSLDASRRIIDADTWTLFQWLPRTTGVLWTCYLLLLVQTVALLVGFLARFQAACVFVWLVSFYHRNQLIFDGEDTVFRLFCFYLILLPIGDHYAVDSWWKRRRSGSSEQPPVHPIWPLRLVQIQWTLIYLSSAMEKFNGPEWLDGTALYYVSRLDDMFGKFPVPAVLFDSMIAIKLMTWSVLTLETLVPIGLWIKPTRTAAVMLAAAFHLATDYTMNLFLFHWIMLVGLLSFIPSERRPD